VLEYPGEDRPSTATARGLFNITVSGFKKPTARASSTTAAFSNTGSDGGKLGFEYLSSSTPRQAARRLPVRVRDPEQGLTIPLEFEFKDVPLRESGQRWFYVEDDARSFPLLPIESVL